MSKEVSCSRMVIWASKKKLSYLDITGIPSGEFTVLHVPQPQPDLPRTGDDCPGLLGRLLRGPYHGDQPGSARLNRHRS